MVSEGVECVMDNRLQCFVLLVSQKTETQEKWKWGGKEVSHVLCRFADHAFLLLPFNCFGEMCLIIMDFLVL